jgi:hypothetical protein
VFEQFHVTRFELEHVTNSKNGYTSVLRFSAVLWTERKENIENRIEFLRILIGCYNYPG